MQFNSKKQTLKINKQRNSHLICKCNHLLLISHLNAKMSNKISLFERRVFILRYRCARCANTASDAKWKHLKCNNILKCKQKSLTPASFYEKWRSLRSVALNLIFMFMKLLITYLLV